MSDHSQNLPATKTSKVLEKANAIELMAESLGVELDIQPTQVASIAIKHKLSNVQLDSLMLARSDHDARFSVINILLLNNFTVNQIFAAFYIVDNLMFTSDEKPYEIYIAPVLVEEPKSLQDILSDNFDSDSIDEDQLVLLEGEQHLQLNRKNKYVVMIATWLATLDVFADIQDLDEIMNLLGTITDNAKPAFGWYSYNDLDCLTRLLVKISQRGINNYDDLLRYIAAINLEDES